MKKNTITFLSADDIRSSVPMPQAIEAMKTAFASLTDGSAKVPQRMRMDFERGADCALFMPVYSSNFKQFGIKSVPIFNENPARGLPRIHALFNLFDGETGKPLAVMDAEYLTALRTGAASGLATDLLAKQDSKVLAVFGAGAQARTQIEGVCAIREIKEVLISARDLTRTEKFAREMSDKLSLPVRVMHSPDELKGADIICTATTATLPVFMDENLKEVAHINGVGSYKPDMCEIPPETINRAKLVVDSRSACFTEAGDIMQPLKEGKIKKESIYAELGEIVRGTKSPRQYHERITVFKSVGNAVQDLALANLALKLAIESETGQIVKL